MIKMLQYKMYPAGELAVLRQLLFNISRALVECVCWGGGRGGGGGGGAGGEGGVCGRVGKL